MSQSDPEETKSLKTRYNVGVPNWLWFFFSLVKKMTRIFKTATRKRTVSEWRLLSSYHLSEVKWPLLLFLLTSFFFGWQELIEKVMILKKAVERERRLFVDSGSPILAEKLRYRWWDYVDGFQSRDKTAMLVHKTIANYVLHNNRMKFPKYFFFCLALSTNMAAVRSGENHPFATDLKKKTGSSFYCSESEAKEN